MSIRISVSATSDEAPEQDVLIDAHHISIDREWFEHPIRSHRVPIGGKVELLKFQLPADSPLARALQRFVKSAG